MAPEQIEIRRLDGGEAREHLDALAAVLHDCVAGGASVSYMAPFSLDDPSASAGSRAFVSEAEQGRPADHWRPSPDDELVGTVQVILGH